MASRRLALGACVVLLCATFARAAHAEPTASEKETARTMMDEGHARRDAGDHKGALAQFQGADALMHVPTTAIEVGREQIALGQLVEARDTLERVMRMPQLPGEPDAFRVARKAADTLDQEIASRIPALRITSNGAPPGAGIDIAIDGAPIPSAALIAPIKVDPGHHLVVATGTNGGARREIDVAEGQTLAVALTVTPTSSSSPASQVPPAEPGTKGSASSTVGWLRWGGIGLAGVGVVVGAVTGVMSLSSTSTATKACVNDRCPPSTWGDIDSARTTATVSTVAFIVAGVGAGLAVTSFVVDGHGAGSPKDGAAEPRPRVTAWVGPGSVSLAGTF
jgi:hypothetical protein